MKKLGIFASFLIATLSSFLVATTVFAQGTRTIPVSLPEANEATESAEIEPTPRPDITVVSEETTGPLEELLEGQELGPVFPANPIKYGIRAAIGAGVAPNTIVLLLLLPVIAALIAASRHLIGLRGFGIFLPAALSVVFVATGPVVGIGLFLVIVLMSVFVRMVLRRTNIKLQYLPRMSLILLFVVFGVLSVLFAAPVIGHPDLANAGIFPILILVLLSEDFTKVQLGKSFKTAINITTETLILALISFVFLTYTPLQEFALLNPEILLISVLVVDFVLGKYVGLRLAEYWRFRKLLVR